MAIRKKSTDTRRKAGHKTITIRGLIVPADWDEKGNVTATRISTFDEEEYFLEKSDKEKELFAFLREEVVISGELRVEEGEKIIKVTEFTLITNKPQTKE